jgi:ABC-type dipeptide/oligopeptide/nickel transport system permease component
MGRFILARILSAIPTLLIVSLTVFALMRMIPGDPAALMLGDLAQPGQVEAMRQEMGLDRPFAVQYLLWLGDVAAGDFGLSIATGDPVLPEIWDKFTVSASIVFAAILLAALVAVPAGMIAAWRQNKATDFAVIGVATVLLSVPSFWLGLMLLLVFGLWLGCCRSWATCPSAAIPGWPCWRSSCPSPRWCSPNPAPSPAWRGPPPSRWPGSNTSPMPGPRACRRRPSCGAMPSATRLRRPGR